MIVIPPLEITAAKLTSSTITEPASGEVAWNAATSYAPGTVVIRTTTHRKYERQGLTASVDAGLPESTPNLWLDVGPTAKWAMFDYERQIVQDIPGPFTVVITPGQRVNSIFLRGVRAKTATITMKQGATTVHGPIVRNMNKRVTRSWFEYFFGVFEDIPTLLITNLPPYYGATIEITLENGASDVRCSQIVLGNKVYLGKAMANAVSDSQNFSKIERDDFGNAKVIKRRTVPLTQQRLVTDKSAVDDLVKLRTDLNAVAAVWSSLDDKTTDGWFEAFLIFGLYERFQIDAAYSDYALVNLDVKEL